MLCFRSSATAKEEVAQGIFLNVYFIKLLNDFNSIPLSLFPDNWRIEPLLNSDLPFLLNIHSYSFRYKKQKKKPS